MRSTNDLPEKVAGVEKIVKHDNDVARTEAEESFKAAELVAQKDPTVEKWLKSHKDLWYR